MTKSHEKSVFFVGKPRPAAQVLNDSLADCGIRAHVAESADECCKSVREKACDLLVIDLDGTANHQSGLIAELRRAIREIPTVALVDHGDIRAAVEVMKAGVTDCLEKPVGVQRLVEEVKNLLRQSDQDSRHAPSVLTPMEIAVLELLMEGKTNIQVGRAIHRSSRTVEGHRRKIMRKLKVSNAVDLVRVAATMGLFEGSHDEPLGPGK